MELTKVIGIASDHAGYELKRYVNLYLFNRGYIYRDYGTYSEESCDYPDYGHGLARAMEAGDLWRGIGICGSGEGIAMTLNKHQTIRAGLAWCPEIARLIRQHNDANVLVLPGRFLNEDQAREILDVFLNTEFEGGRHQLRVDKIPIREEDSDF